MLIINLFIPSLSSTVRIALSIVRSVTEPNATVFGRFMISLVVVKFAIMQKDHPLNLTRFLDSVVMSQFDR